MELTVISDLSSLTPNINPSYNVDGQKPVVALKDKEGHQHNIEDIKLKVAVQTAIFDIDNAINNVHTEIYAVKQNFTAINTVVNSISTNVSTIQSSVNKAHTLIGNLEGAVTSVSETAKTLITNVSEMQGDVNNIHIDITNIVGEITSVSEVAKTLQTNVSNINKNLSTQINDLATDINAIHTQIDELSNASVSVDEDAMVQVQVGDKLYIAKDEENVIGLTVYRPLSDSNVSPKAYLNNQQVSQYAYGATDPQSVKISINRGAVREIQYDGSLIFASGTQQAQEYDISGFGTFIATPTQNVAFMSNYTTVESTKTFEFDVLDSQNNGNAIPLKGIKIKLYDGKDYKNAENQTWDKTFTITPKVYQLYLSLSTSIPNNLPNSGGTYTKQWFNSVYSGSVSTVAFGPLSLTPPSSNSKLFALIPQGSSATLLDKLQLFNGLSYGPFVGWQKIADKSVVQSFGTYTITFDVYVSLDVTNNYANYNDTVQIKGV